VDDVESVAKQTQFTTGLKKGSGDPSPATARGVFYGIQEALINKLGKENLKDVRVLIQGVGHVGTYLAEHLSQAGSKVYVSDIESDKVDFAVRSYGATAVNPSELFGLECDVFSPCALGQVVEDDKIPSFRFPIISGGANNQLQHETTTPLLLHQNNILHSPDYVINAGGIINIYVIDFLKETNIEPWLKKIPINLKMIFDRSSKKNKAPFFVANELAEERIKRQSVDA